MKIAKLSVLALVPALLAGCVLDDGPVYDSGYSRTYYVDSDGNRHYYRHHRYYRNEPRVYSGTYGGSQQAGGYSGSYGGQQTRVYSASTPQGASGSAGGAPSNPSRPSGFGRSGGVSPIPTTPSSAPRSGYSGSNPSTAPAPKIILNKPNPSLPHGPSSTHVLTPEKKSEPSSSTEPKSYSGTVGTSK